MKLISRSISSLVLLMGQVSILAAEPSAAMRVWEVQAMKYGSALICEAHMRGRNSDGGGDYTVRLLVNGNTPTFVIEHEGAPFPGNPEAVFTINNEFKVMSRPIAQDKWGGHTAFEITLTFENFTQKFIPNLENPAAQTWEIAVGPRKYLLVAQGFKDVSAAMGRCSQSLPHLRGENK